MDFKIYKSRHKKPPVDGTKIIGCWFGNVRVKDTVDTINPEIRKGFFDMDTKRWFVMFDDCYEDLTGEMPIMWGLFKDFQKSIWQEFLEKNYRL
jgi:hypothetical protein